MKEQKVRKGHIIPAVYQRNFAVNKQVMVHLVGGGAAEIRNVKTAGTRGPYYRRTRPDGTTTEDVEGMLSQVESGVQPAFAAVCGGAELASALKLPLAQFFGLQMVRGPAFFAERSELLSDVIGRLNLDVFLPEAVEEAGGDLEELRRRYLDQELSSTKRFRRMFGLAMRMAAVLGSMRWHLLEFDGPLLAFSDHPVVVWPAGITASEPFPAPHLGPLTAVEVRVPLSARLAILMVWSDLPDKGTPVAAERRFAAEINAGVISQADAQWMHAPGADPPIATGILTPMHRSFELAYTVDDIASSRRREFASDFLEQVRDQEYVDEVAIADMGWPESGLGGGPQA